MGSSSLHLRGVHDAHPNHGAGCRFGPEIEAGKVNELPHVRHGIVHPTPRFEVSRVRGRVWSSLARPPVHNRVQQDGLRVWPFAGGWDRHVGLLCPEDSVLVEGVVIACRNNKEEPQFM